MCIPFALASCEATTTVTVPVESILLTDASATVSIDTPVWMDLGQTLILRADLFSASGDLLTGRDISWTSTNDAVAMVTANGATALVAAIGAGETAITATTEGTSATARIEVRPSVATVTVTPPAGSLQVGDTLRLSATTRDALGNVLTGRVISWISDGVAVAKVTGNGSTALVTAIAAGETTITAESDGRKGWVRVTVSPKLVAHPVNLVVNGDFSMGNVGFSSQYAICSRAPGCYNLTTEAGTLNGWWSGTDHTTGTGLFMAVDGAYDSQRVVWSQLIEVRPSSEYTLRFWYLKIDLPSNDIARLLVTINGVPVADTLSVTSRAWREFSVAWDSRSDRTALIEIRDVLTSTRGNGGDDFGLDDFSFIGSIPDFYFLATSESHDETTADLDQICSSTFGHQYRLADWADLKTYYASGKSMIDLHVRSGWNGLGTSVLISRENRRWYSSRRHYFASWHDHTTPGGYLVHDDIDNHLIDLGSWWNARPVLCAHAAGSLQEFQE